MANSFVRSLVRCPALRKWDPQKRKEERRKGSFSPKVSAKFSAKMKKSSPLGTNEGVDTKTSVPTSFLPVSPNSDPCGTRKAHPPDSKRSSDGGRSNAEKLQENVAVAEEDSSQSPTCASSLSSNPGSASSVSSSPKSAAQTVPTVSSLIGSDLRPHLVEETSPTDGMDPTRSRSSSHAKSQTASSSDAAASRSGASLPSPHVVHEETATVAKSLKKSKTVRFHEVPEVRLVEQVDDISAERQTAALWYTADEEASMRQQPIGTLEDVLERAISIAACERSSTPVSKLRICTLFLTLLRELEHSGKFAARGLESTLRDIATGQSSSVLVETVVEAVLMEQRKLHDETGFQPLDCDEQTVALAKVSIEHSCRSRAEALKLGHLDAIEVLEYTYGALLLAGEDDTDEEDENISGSSTFGVFGTQMHDELEVTAA